MPGNLILFYDLEMLMAPIVAEYELHVIIWRS